MKNIPKNLILLILLFILLCLSKFLCMEIETRL